MINDRCHEMLLIIHDQCWSMGYIVTPSAYVGKFWPWRSVSNFISLCIRQHFRSTLQMSCNASPQIWRFTWCRKCNFNLIFGIVRCSAFWICITLWGQKWTVWPWECIFSQKMPKKQLFGNHDHDHPTLERHNSLNFKDWDLFQGCFRKFGT